jgi:hypothetical protein
MEARDEEEPLILSVCDISANIPGVIEANKIRILSLAFENREIPKVL